LLVQELPDEVLVYDLKRSKAHCLNETAAFVWNHCDGRTAVPELATLMEEEWGKPVGEEVVWLALKQLSRANLLSEPIEAGNDGIRVSRRAVLRKLGAAAAMTPLVISIVAPTASAGASVPPECTVCTSFGGTGSKTNNCPAICLNFPGCCFGNASCDTGQGNPLGTFTCQQCFDIPDSKGYRVTGAACA
jgi:hypothetical protein